MLLGAALHWMNIHSSGSLEMFARSNLVFFFLIFSIFILKK